MVYCYILKCADGSFYTGISQNIVVRVSQHFKGRVSYTKKRLPVKLIFSIELPSRKDAARLERRIKNTGAKKYLIRNFGGIDNSFIHL